MKKPLLQGFTLLELSIVIIIISILSAMAVSSSLGVLENARQASTERKMQQIEQALLQYRIANDRLPCPANLTVTSGNSTFGTEVADTGNSTTRCGNANFSAQNSAGTAIAVAEGGVPAVTLGLPADFMYDGWGNRLDYAVKVDMTYPGSFTGTPVGALCGGITVSTGPGYPAGTTLSSNALYVLASHGANGHGAYTKNGVIVNASSSNSDEQTNCHCNSSAAVTTYTATYVQEAPVTQDTSNPLLNFDDVVVFRERWQLQAAGDKAGTACPAVYLTDVYWALVTKFDLYGNYLGQLGIPYGIASGQIGWPRGISVDKSGNIWIADNNRVEKFDANATFIAGIGAGYNGVSGAIITSGTGKGQFNGPDMAIVDSNSSVWTLESLNHRIQKFDRNLNYLFSIPPSGTIQSSANGSFSYPNAIAIDAQDNVWVADTNNNRIQQFRNNGEWIQSIGGLSPYTCRTSPNTTVPACDSGYASGQIYYPNSVAVDKMGNIWTYEPGGKRMQKFSPAGTFIGMIGTIGVTGNNIATDPYNNVWLADFSSRNLTKCTLAGSCTAYNNPTASFFDWELNYGIYVSGR